MMMEKANQVMIIHADKEIQKQFRRKNSVYMKSNHQLMILLDHQLMDLMDH
jgi:hypothetical protein